MLKKTKPSNKVAGSYEITEYGKTALTMGLERVAKLVALLALICGGLGFVEKPNKLIHIRNRPPLPLSSRTSRESIHPRCMIRAMSATGTSGVGSNPYYAGQDAYSILGIKKGADKKAIKVAYRKLVSTWHPDKFPDSEEKKLEGGLRMEKINRAYFCLEDDDRKRRYDLYGEKAVGTSASSEERLKKNADTFFSDNSAGRRYHTGDSSGSSTRDGGGGDGGGDTYRVEDDPFVWSQFRKEQEEQRERYRQAQRERDRSSAYEPQRQRSADNQGEEWADDWWKSASAAAAAAGGGEGGGSTRGPRRPAYGSSSSSSPPSASDAQYFPNAESSYEDIMDFLRRTGGAATTRSGSGAGSQRLYDDDTAFDSPRLRKFRIAKSTLVAERGALQRRLGDSGVDWGGGD